MDNTIFWADHTLSTIEMMKRDGTGRTTVLRGDNIDRPSSLDVFESTLYWISTGKGELRRQDKFGRGVMVRLVKDIATPSTVKGRQPFNSRIPVWLKHFSQSPFALKQCSVNIDTTRRSTTRALTARALTCASSFRADIVALVPTAQSKFKLEAKYRATPRKKGLARLRCVARARTAASASVTAKSSASVPTITKVYTAKPICCADLRPLKASLQLTSLSPFCSSSSLDWQEPLSTSSSSAVQAVLRVLDSRASELVPASRSDRAQTSNLDQPPFLETALPPPPWYEIMNESISFLRIMC